MPEQKAPLEPLMKVSEALALPVDSSAKVSGLVKPAGEGWLTITDTSDTIYAWGPDFEGEAVVTGKIKEYQNSKYLQLERIRRAKKAPLLMKILPIALIALVPLILYFGIILSIPDFHIADIIGPNEPPLQLSDLKRDKLTSYSLELIWHEGPILCAELRNTGKIVLPREDLDRIVFSIDNSSVSWNRSTLPDKLPLGKRLDLCLCTEIGPGCPENATLFRFEKVGENYPSVAVEVRPWFGTVSTGKYS
ncbi:MAG: hypothetical protein V1820_02810 [archaeon]